jgi:hypothetical protein
VGHWEGKYTNILKSGQDPRIAKVAEALINPKLDLDEDHTFRMNLGLPMRGKWSQDGDRITSWIRQ